jgi:uncharacterized membrane protein YhaH (DUF805 family)
MLSLNSFNGGRPVQQAPTFGRRGAQQPSAPVEVTHANTRNANAYIDEARPSRAPAKQSFIVWLLTSFEGRIRRSHYWLAYIGLSIFVVVGENIVRAAFPHYPTTLQMIRDPAIVFDDSIANLVPAMLILLVAVPALYMRAAVTTKRWHDRGRTGWFTIFSYVPLLTLWPFIELGFFDGKPGENRFGQSPKSPGVDLDVFS